MRVGTLDRKITIQFRTLTQNDYGEAVSSFSTSFEAWAKLDTKATGAREDEVDGLEKAIQRVVFLIRYSTDVASITSGDRVSYSGKLYDIENVVELGRNTSLRLLCKLVE